MISEVKHQESYLFKNEENFVDKTCDQLNETMKKVSNVQPIVIINSSVESLVNDLNEEETDKILSGLKKVSSLVNIELLQDLNAQEKLDELIFPDVRPIADKELLDIAKVLKDDIDLLTEFYDILSRALEKELTIIATNAAFETFKKPIEKYHAIHIAHRGKRSLVQKHYIKVTLDLDDRIKKDHEKIENDNRSYLSSTLSYITPRIVSDPEKNRTDILDTLDYVFGMKKGDSTKGVNEFHDTTATCSNRFDELKIDYINYKEVKRSAKRKLCYLIYLHLNKARPGSYWNDNFQKEYDLKQHRYLKKELKVTHDDFI